MWRNKVEFPIPNWLLERWIIVAYLVPPPDDFGEHIKVRPDEKFWTVLGEHLQAYVKDGKMPPAQIATAVVNLADDFLNGRQMTMRTGDYIAVHNFVRGAHR
jgi:hypothetical protein